MDRDGEVISANHRDLASREIPRKGGGNERFWRPFTLNPWFASFLLLLVLSVAIALEVGLHFSNIRTGWQITGKSSLASSTIHYATRLIPVIIAMGIVGLWAGTDADIKRMQPFIELASGNAPASHTLFVDYVNSHYAKAFFESLRNKHHIVAVSSAMLVLGFAVQPLAASIFSMKDVWWRLPETSIRTFNTPGLDLTYTNLSVISASMGLVAATALNDISTPMFVKGIWALEDIELPTSQVANGSIFTNVTAIRSLPNCRQSNNITMKVQISGLLGIIGEVDGCRIGINEPVIPEGTEWYNSIVFPSCPDMSDPHPEFTPFLILVVHINPQGGRSNTMVYCKPTIDLVVANVQIEIKTGEFIVHDFTNYTLSNNITDPSGFMKGRAFNGFIFGPAPSGQTPSSDIYGTYSSTFTTALETKAIRSPMGLEGQIKSDGMLSITEELYSQYLSTMAKGIYFLRSDARSNPAFIETWQTRLFIVPSATHVLTVLLLLFLISGIAVHILHSRYRAALHLTRRPGTLAAAIGYTANSNLQNRFRSVIPEDRFNDYLAEKHFKLDMGTARIVMDESDDEADLKESSPLRSPQYIESGESLTNSQEYNGAARSTSSVLVPGKLVPNGVRGVLISSWTPMPLRLWFGMSIIVLSLIISAALIAGVQLSKSQGWKISNIMSATEGFLHYAIILPPAALAITICTIWKWTDNYIKRMQPFIELAHGNSPGSRSILLDYSQRHPIIGISLGTVKRHYLVVLSSVIVVTTLALQPLMGSIFAIQSVEHMVPGVSITNPSIPGFNFTDTAFLTAAQFLQAKSLYNISFPKFINENWAIGDFDIPTSFAGRNGSLQVNTTAYSSNMTSCRNVPTTNVTFNETSSVYNMEEIQLDSNCKLNTTLLLELWEDLNLDFGSSIGPAVCIETNQTEILTPTGANILLALQPVVFFLPISPPYNESDELPVAVIYCQPTLELMNATVEVDLTNGNFTVLQATKDTQANTFTDSNNLLHGHVLNGLIVASVFNRSDPLSNVFSDPENTQHPLSSNYLNGPPTLMGAINQAAQGTPGGFDTGIRDGSLVDVIQDYYSMYLTLAAKQLYFTKGNGTLQAVVRLSESRLFVTPLAAYLLTAILLGNAIMGAIVHLAHKRARRMAPFPRQPNTLAAAFALTLDSNVGDIVKGYDDNETLDETLGNRVFFLDKTTGGIHVENDEGQNEERSSILAR
ncbi:hypothetical protein M422DRAFT_779902 [Sphaerobolus stellatus SS14]|uniref:Uncharacterized protein n=1 Tax=Sphaerobolus stellatus (strain SS14) TaxID=990650 RepID=A0A0C9VVW5_SPHS4|nr:hypothetical protein M422DRAFT_779902 [Sphaerobolus stellatus SS14]